jgi:ankyrin repeat protein
MKRAVLAAILILASSVALADTTNVLLDIEKVSGMGAEEYAAAVRSSPNIEARNNDGMTPLHIAAAVGTPDNTAALVTAGADIEARNKEGWTPLHIAAAVGTPDNITALLKAGASGSVKAKDGKTAFDYAEDNGRVKGTDAYWALNDAQYK